MYTIEHFGDITLPRYMTTYTLSPVTGRANLIETTAGVFDNDGAARNLPVFPFPLSYKCIVYEDVYAANRAPLDALRAAVGTRARLYRRANDDNTTQYCIARLSANPHERPYTQPGYFEITLDFQQMSPWLGIEHGVVWRFDSGEIFDGGRTFDESPPIALTTVVTPITLTNGGNLPCHDMVIEVKSGATPLTSLTITSETTNQGLHWSGTLYPSGELRIDTAAWSVLNLSLIHI